MLHPEAFFTQKPRDFHGRSGALQWINVLVLAGDPLVGQQAIQLFVAANALGTYTRIPSRR